MPVFKDPSGTASATAIRDSRSESRMINSGWTGRHSVSGVTPLHEETPSQGAKRTDIGIS